MWAPLSLAVRTEVKVVKKEFDKTEDDLKALQSVGQIIGEVLRQLDEERCAPPLRPAHLLICRRRRRRRRRATAIALRAAVIVKASSGPRYVVGCRNKIEKAKLVQSTRVSLDMTTLTIMRALPREVDPVVFNMLTEDPGNVSYGDVGGAPPRSADRTRTRARTRTRTRWTWTRMTLTTPSWTTRPSTTSSAP